MLRLPLDRLVPAGAHLTRGAGGLDRLKPRHGFNQHALFRLPVGKAALGQARQKRLHRQPREQHHRNGQRGHQRQRPADQIDHADKERDEGQVDHGHQSGRGKELAQGFELAQGVGHGPGRTLARVHLHVQQLVKDAPPHLCIGAVAGPVDEAGTQHLDHEIKEQRQTHPKGQRNERFRRLVRQHPVIDDHDKDRGRQPQHVGQNSGQDHLGIRPAVGGERGPEPMPMPPLGGGSDVVAVFTAKEQRIAGVAVAQLALVNFTDAFAQGRIVDQQPPLGVAAMKNHGTVIFQQQDGRRQCGVELAELAGAKACLQPGAFGSGDGVADAERAGCARLRRMQRGQGDGAVQTVGHM